MKERRYVNRIVILRNVLVSIAGVVSFTFAVPAADEVSMVFPFPPSSKSYFRSDSACHEHRLIDWLRDEQRKDGPQGFLGFAISACMSEALTQAVRAVPEAEWKPYATIQHYDFGSSSLQDFPQILLCGS
jgi:hypothetical protein